jgi:hypothetical protein
LHYLKNSFHLQLSYASKNEKVSIAHFQNAFSLLLAARDLSVLSPAIFAFTTAKEKFAGAK